MAVRELISIEEFEAMAPPVDCRYELVDGVIVEMTFPTPKHNRIVKRLLLVLDPFVDDQGIGEIFTADTGFVLADDPPTLRGPDLSFVRAERLATLDAARNIAGAPDLAVEVLSPSEALVDVRRKVRQYLEAGCDTVWVVDSENSEVQIHRSNSVTIVGATEMLTSPEVLPGFRILVGDLFRV